jgi:2'-5' RNA ligase
MKRLFFGLWPEPEIRRDCKRIMEKIEDTHLQPVATKNLHVTLVFLGQVNPQQELAICATADTLTVPVLSIKFDKLSYWQNPGILCLTSNCYYHELTQLAAKLSYIAKSNGISLEERPYKPHLTLGRKAITAIELEFAPLIWHSEGFCLFESCSLVDGIEYRVVRRWGSIKEEKF